MRCAVSKRRRCLLIIFLLLCGGLSLVYLHKFIIDGYYQAARKMRKKRSLVSAHRYFPTISTLKLSPDNTRLLIRVCWEKDSEISVINWRTGEVEYYLKQPEIIDLGWHSSGKAFYIAKYPMGIGITEIRLLSLSGKVLRTWDMENLHPTLHLSVPVKHRGWLIAWLSPSGNQLFLHAGFERQDRKAPVILASYVWDNGKLKLVNVGEFPFGHYFSRGEEIWWFGTPIREAALYGCTRVVLHHYPSFRTWNIASTLQLPRKQQRHECFASMGDGVFAAYMREWETGKVRVEMWRLDREPKRIWWHKLSEYPCKVWVRRHPDRIIALTGRGLYRITKVGVVQLLHWGRERRWWKGLVAELLDDEMIFVAGSEGIYLVDARAGRLLPVYRFGGRR